MKTAVFSLAASGPLCRQIFMKGETQGLISSSKIPPFHHWSQIIAIFVMHTSSTLFAEMWGCKANTGKPSENKGSCFLPQNNNVSVWAPGIPPGLLYCGLGLLEDCVTSEFLSLSSLYIPRIDDSLFYVFTGEAASKGERFRCWIWRGEVCEPLSLPWDRIHWTHISADGSYLTCS